MNEIDRIRSHAGSILKCDYGWNGVIPGESNAEWMEFEQVESEALAAGESAECVAARLAAFIYERVGQRYFRERIDGKPNRRDASAALAYILKYSQKHGG